MIRNVLTLLLSTVVALAIGEAVLRILRPAGFSRSLQPCLYVEDETIGFRYAPNATGRIHRSFEIDRVVRMNSAGFHDVEHVSSAETDRPRVVVVGDSFTAAMHVEIPDAWTHVMERALARSDGRLSPEVVALGLDGTGTDVHLHLLKQYLPVYEPRVVVLSFVANDIGDMERKRTYRECYDNQVLVFQDRKQQRALRAFVERHRPGRLTQWTYDSFYIVRGVCSQLARRAAQVAPATVLLTTNYLTPSTIGLPVDDRREVPPDVDGVFESLLALQREHGFELAVVPMPVKYGIGASGDALREAVSPELWERLPVVDLTEPVERSLEQRDLRYPDLFWRHDGHFNRTGNEVFGRAVGAAIAPLLD